MRHGREIIKFIIFVLIICCTPLSFLFGAASKLENPALPRLNPVQTTLISEQAGPSEAESTSLSPSCLEYKGSLLLNSPHPAFGGFSDLLISEDRKTFLAVSDMGFWLKGTLEYSPSGFLKGVGRNAQLGQLLNTEGKTFAVKYNSDSEALCRAPGSGYLVAYERVNRINHYNSKKELDLSGAAISYSLPPGISKIPENGGIESLVLLPDNRLLILTEGDSAYGNQSYAAIQENGKWLEFKYIRDSGFRPTSAGNLPDDKIIILERKYKGPGTLGIRFSLMDSKDISESAVIRPKPFYEMQPQLPRDNYEGLDTVVTPDGKIFIYIISDDNFSPLQHTFITMFELDFSRMK